MMNFTVVVCYAVPSLKTQVKVIDAGIAGPDLPRPDFFTTDTRTPHQVRELTLDYKSTLASNMLISSFSYFEAYVIGVIKEMIDFHGGNDLFIQLAERRSSQFMTTPHLSGKVKLHKRKLQDRIDKHKQDKYRKYSRELEAVGYRFPSELLSSYGVRMLISKTHNLRSVDIPDILQHGLHMKLSPERLKKFDNIRRTRNDIAHGKRITVLLKDAMNDTNFLNEFGKDIDEHLTEHFFVIEKYI